MTTPDFLDFMDKVRVYDLTQRLSIHTPPWPSYMPMGLQYFSKVGPAAFHQVQTRRPQPRDARRQSLGLRARHNHRRDAIPLVQHLLNSRVASGTTNGRVIFASVKCLLESLRLHDVGVA